MAMPPSPSFGSFKKLQYIVLFSSLTILYLIYALGTAEYSTTSIDDDFWSTPRPSLPKPSFHQTKAKAKAVPADTDEYVAFCIAHRNQLRDLPEFLNHHYHHHGIRRFYIMDDRSDPPLSRFKDFGIPRSALSFQYYDEQGQHPHMQEHIYSDCARLYGSQHTWMAFIDADEFFETGANETLPSILREFDKPRHVGALGVNWRIHSSANLTKRPDSMRRSFTRCVDDPEVLPPSHLPAYKDNRLIKSIVKTSAFERPLSPHMFKTHNGTHTVGEHGDKIADGDGVRQPITRDRIGLHHYTLKSREQFEEKMMSWTAKGWEYWNHIEGLPQVQCHEMTKYHP
jgi:hypothetical protein